MDIKHINSAKHKEFTSQPNELILENAKKIAHSGVNLIVRVPVIPTFNDTVEEISALGVTCRGYASNAADFQQAHDTVAQIHKDFGHIDVLVNNAGITRDGLMMRMTEQQWDMVINTNLKSAFNYIHAVTPIMMRQRSGSVINMTSIVGISGNAGQANYAASKAGMIGLTKSVAKELGGRNIRVNAIAPGFIATEMTGVLNEDMKKQWILNIPLHREGKVEDVVLGYDKLWMYFQNGSCFGSTIGPIANRTEALKQLTEELFRYSVVLSTQEDMQMEKYANRFSLPNEIMILKL